MPGNYCFFLSSFPPLSMWVCAKRHTLLDQATKAFCLLPRLSCSRSNTITIGIFSFRSVLSHTVFFVLFSKPVVVRLVDAFSSFHGVTDTADRLSCRGCESSSRLFSVAARLAVLLQQQLRRKEKSRVVRQKFFMLRLFEFFRFISDHSLRNCLEPVARWYQLRLLFC